MYIKYVHKLRPTIQQLTNLCCLTGLNEIVFRNIPLINDTLNNEHVKIALFDFEYFDIQ